MDRLLQGVEYLNQSKYFSGLIMLLLNLGSKFVSEELSEAHQLFLAHPIIRKMLVFTVFFISTKDIVTSLVLTVLFIVLVCVIFHEDSKFCMIKGRLKDFCKNRKEAVSKGEYENAMKIVSQYKSQ